MKKPAKKPVQKKKLGKMLTAISPAAALMKSMKTGKAEGILGMSGLGAMHNAGRKRDVESPSTAAKSTAQRTTNMKTGGRVRGDGICQRGKTKGTMR